MGLEVDYRTVYAALCSQTHSDAEDLLNYFFATANEDQKLMEEISIETVNFSRLMLYFAVKYYVMVAVSYAIRFELPKALDALKLGMDAVTQKLEEIAKELQQNSNA